MNDPTTQRLAREAAAHLRASMDQLQAAHRDLMGLADSEQIEGLEEAFHGDLATDGPPMPPKHGTPDRS